MRDAEMDADTTDTLSEMTSLAGVPGRFDDNTDDIPVALSSTGVDEALPVGGTSPLGVETTLSVLGADRATGEAAAFTVGVGRTGKEARSAEPRDSAALVAAGFITAAIFRVGAAFFSDFRDSTFGVGTAGVSTTAFLPVARDVFPPGSLGTAGIAGAISTVVDLEVSKAGKSSSCKTGFDLDDFECDAISLERPLATAKALMLSRACDPPETVFPREGPEDVAPLFNGVIDRGISRGTEPPGAGIGTTGVTWPSTGPRPGGKDGAAPDRPK